MAFNVLRLKARMSTGDAIRRWLRQIERRYSPNTYVQYKMVLWRFADCAPRHIENLTVEHIENYLLSLKKQSNRTVNCHLIAIKSFCRTVSSWYGLKNPAAAIKKLPEVPPKQRVLTEEEYQKVLAVCKDDEADVIHFLTSTGLRSFEYANIKDGDISNRMLHVVGKGKKTRAIPLNRICQDIIKSGLIHLPKNELRNLCERLSRKAGIPIVGPHSYRHYFADSLRRKGVPIYTISKLLGHTSVKTTERYLHPTEEDLQGVTDCLDD